LPGLSAVWSLVVGAGTGSSLVVALSLISLRGRTQAETTQLSGMAQSVGYLVAACGPIAAGLLAGRTGTWQAPLVLLVALASAQTMAAVIAGRDRRGRGGPPRGGAAPAGHRRRPEAQGHHAPSPGGNAREPG